MSNRKRDRVIVYISGPLSTGDLAKNIAASCEVYRELVRRGYAAICPHLSAFADFDRNSYSIFGPVVVGKVEPAGIPYERWINCCLGLIPAVDVVLRLPGESNGSDRETELAKQHGIPVVGSIDELPPPDGVTGEERVQTTEANPWRYFAARPEGSGVFRIRRDGELTTFYAKECVLDSTDTLDWLQENRREITEDEAASIVGGRPWAELPVPVSCTESSPSAYSRQEGGYHYAKMAIQPAHFIHTNGIGFLAGTAIKYLCRYKDKGGKLDLEKAKHFIEMLIDEEYGRATK